MIAAPGWAVNQGTLARELRLSGHGLHTGKRVNVRVHPEDVGHGIVFRRMRGAKQLALLPASAALRLCRTPMAGAFALSNTCWQLCWPAR